MGVELTNVHWVAFFGFIAAVVFGAVANKTSFCTMGAVSDWVNMSSKGRLGAWFAAMGIAISGAQVLEWLELVDLSATMYRSKTVNLGGYICGGFLFGVGMTLAGGCGQRSLVRLGGGSLKSFVVVLVMGLTAYMTVRGILGLVRVGVVEPLSIDLATFSIDDQGLARLLTALLGLDNTATLQLVLGIMIGVSLILYAVKQVEFRKSANNILAGVVVGFAVLIGWLITGYVGIDDFDPVPLESLTFVSPIGNAINYLMTFTGSTINFGIASVFGVILGSFLYAFFSDTIRIEAFRDRDDMVNHLWGGVLMGFGGVMALGCTIGQGVTGLSTLAVGSFIAIVAIVFGSALTMKFQYYRLDDISMSKALILSLADIFVPGRQTIN
jgi:uncharacterized membrane protein YedE/YeeE